MSPLLIPASDAGPGKTLDTTTPLSWPNCFCSGSDKDAISLTAMPKIFPASSFLSTVVSCATFSSNLPVVTETDTFFPSLNIVAFTFFQAGFFLQSEEDRLNKLFVVHQNQ